MMNSHAQEPTMVSATETIGRQADDGLPPTPSVSLFTGGQVQTTSPNPFHAHPPTHEATLDPRTFPSVIPPKREHRTLVLCFDGTGDQFDADNSNIVQFVSLLKKDDRHQQMIYYQTGIGTYTPTKAATPFLSRFQKTLDTMVAWNLDRHVMSGYEFLMQNYIQGDKICIFGFSRGAYTARSLAGMLHKVGLLPANNHQQVPFAYKMYTRVDEIGWEQSNGFKKAFCIDVTIDFLGVWDTVDSVGLFPKRLPFTTSNHIVRVFRHAISLDERRAKFKANLWNRPNARETQLGVKASTVPQPNQPPSPTDEKAHSEKAPSEKAASEKIPSALPSPTTPQTPILPTLKKSNGSGHKNGNGKKGGSHTQSEQDKKLNTMEKIFSTQKERTDIEEVWFAGCHCDVGGGSVSNMTRHSLARIPLRWMIRECFKANTGIMFESEALREIGLDPATLYPFVTPRPPPRSISTEHKIRKPPAEPIPVRLHSALTRRQAAKIIAERSVRSTPFLGSEEEEELHDALSPAYDQLKLKRGWWILELLPMQLRYQRGDNQWVSTFGLNLAKPRFIPKQVKNGVKVHRSVKMRMEAEFEARTGKKYAPKARLRVEPTWVD